jgi:hypothetical protein
VPLTGKSVAGMQLKVVAFAQARDQLGYDEFVVDC